MLYEAYHDAQSLEHKLCHLAVKTVMSCHVVFQSVITISMTTEEYNYIVTL
jgi:hypothetical protein